MIRPWAERNTRTRQTTQHGRGQGHEDDVAAHLVELGEDRHRIPPDADDAHHLSVEAEREEFAQDGGRAQGRAGRAARGNVDDVYDGSISGTGLDERSRRSRFAPRSVSRRRK